MELVFIAIGCMALGWFLARVGFRVDGGMFVPLVRGHPPIGPREWPVGVQEEDEDRPWGHRALAQAETTVEPDLRPTLERVKPGVRVR